MLWISRDKLFQKYKPTFGNFSNASTGPRHVGALFGWSLPRGNESFRVLLASLLLCFGAVDLPLGFPFLTFLALLALSESDESPLLESESSESEVESDSDSLLDEDSTFWGFFSGLAVEGEGFLGLFFGFSFWGLPSLSGERGADDEVDGRAPITLNEKKFLF